MAQQSIIDVDSLVGDLRLCVDYAARAGLLNDRKVLEALQTAQAAVAEDKAADLGALTFALNEVTQIIRPITVADLKFGRNPFCVENQRRSRVRQFCLSFFAILVLVTIGHFMHALSIEQGAIAEIEKIQAMRPEMKLTELRNMAEHDDPVLKRTALYSEFHQRLAELKGINNQVSVIYMSALEASRISLFPFGHTVSELWSSLWTTEDETPAIAGPIATAAAAPTEIKAPSAPPPPVKVTAAPEAPAGACTHDGSGALRMPKVAGGYPAWMQRILMDTLTDFCFQIAILSSDGSSSVINQSLALSELEFIPYIKEKVSLRTTWFLPFLYGLLGSVVFVMRTIASVRTAAIEWFSIITRLSLGAVAGIVIGWFSFVASPGIESTTTLSIPFALAFLAGYSIDVVFTLLDRLNRAIGDSAKPAHS